MNSMGGVAFYKKNYISVYRANECIMLSLPEMCSALVILYSIYKLIDPERILKILWELCPISHISLVPSLIGHAQ